MVKSEKGRVTIEGPAYEVMADLSVLIGGIRTFLADKYGEETAKEFIDICIKNSTATEEELEAEIVELDRENKEIKEKIAELTNLLDKAIKRRDK